MPTVYRVIFVAIAIVIRLGFVILFADGQLRNIETDEPFKFEVKEGDRAYNQKHYEALGEVQKT